MSLSWSSFNNKENIISDIRSQILEYSDSMYKRVFYENGIMKKDIKLRGRFKRLDEDENIIEIMIKFYESPYKNNNIKNIIIEPSLLKINDKDNTFTLILSLTPIVINVENIDTSSEENSLFYRAIDKVVSIIFETLSVEDEEYINEEWEVLIPTYIKINPSEYLIYESKKSKILDIKNDDNIGTTIFKEWLKKKYEVVDIFFYEKDDKKLFDRVPCAFIQINTLFIDIFDTRLVSIGDSFTKQAIVIPEWNKELINNINEVYDRTMKYIKKIYGTKDIEMKVYLFERNKEVNLNE